MNYEVKFTFDYDSVKEEMDRLMNFMKTSSDFEKADAFTRQTALLQWEFLNSSLQRLALAK
jgi:hypothetical protein